MEKKALLYEGKAKKIYTTDVENIVWVSYKDSATAFNGEKKAEITGKGELNNEITSLLFQKLTDAGVKNHFIEKLSATEQLVKKVDIIPIEVVIRNSVAGSLSKRLGMDEGTELEKAIVEFYYKDDTLGDPLVTEDHIRVLKLATLEELQTLRTLGLCINNVLKEHFAQCNVRLVDFKVEFGKTSDGEIILADEISPDTCRLWDAETNQKLDKDVFRRDLGNVTDGYNEILKRLGGLSCTK
ncbi:phosphoribosylaminoimidazolesuccinocarboxamide synthase [Priestia taiwanensis]|uniref:Phosphoribosylaminoimidazole-succinocarboxamide synthase n=1 Tax=Priestia taiwanensis TaxID=1347902 RepID=A0A917ERF1_9BACI|nr:phosphoribosylaminoimidazolesuccinocarboxamide synthase [Priestia taiwanensis]MBM7364835.1 phosphoribosylaminoimidazole-succinocarboxamide synthase [Priestia taiwanensis]GGE80031.1 phosphoribosylaminoimidazole-succinocarboxamide synthase [Priestia taiwanensis]